jgi:hypothetical protein
MNIVSRKAELEDWLAVKECWETLKNGRHNWKIEGEEPVLRAYFQSSLLSGPLFFPILVDEESGRVYGFAIMQEAQMPSPSADGLTMHFYPHSFIRALYVRSGVKPEESALLDQLMTAWAVGRNHILMTGNCRLDFPERFAQRYGYFRQHVVLTKRLKEV